MPVTRSARRAATRSNTKRTILSALDENKPATIEELQIESSSSTSPECNLPDLDVLKKDSIEVILSDIKSQVKSLQESLTIKGIEMAKNQQEVFFVGTVRLDKTIKNMTIREFNQKYMDNQSIIDVLTSIMSTSSAGVSNNYDQNKSSHNFAHSNLKRGGIKDLETPVRQLTQGKSHRTPGTILRTVRKGEQIFSANGSPVNQTEDGDLIATVSKKRRGNDQGENGAAMFDINIDGRTISLSDPTTMDHLTKEMKNTAMSQLNILQDQLSKLLSHLGSGN
mmetsp:Transcript_4811/g.9178  ORF Transcript_4811/g.9178 Transcript_4811/m.9178 type:complete len:280 (-) Transcript_4811:58-897(-)